MVNRRRRPVQAAARRPFAQPGKLGANFAQRHLRSAASNPGNDGDQPIGRVPAWRRSEQGRGIGKLLLDRFSKDAASRGAGRLHLEVREGNHALSLYERSGFTLIGRRRNYYSGRAGQTYDALTLAKDAPTHTLP